MKVLLSKDDLHDGVSRLADEVAACYSDRQLTIVGVLTGSVVLMADLIRLIDLPMRVGVLQASSYRGATTTRGELVINSELMLDISGRDVLLVDDIFDTGHTLSQVMDKMREFGPTSIRTAVLLRKHGRQEVEFVPDFVGFEYRMNSSSATGWITRICTATCPTWRCWSQPISRSIKR